MVDKGVKVFSTGDEFLVHAFKAHLKVGIASVLPTNTNGEIDHQTTKEWLYEKAEQIVTKCLVPPKGSIDDPVNYLHCSFLHLAFLYVDLREAIRWENGPHIFRHWKWWIPRFLATGCKNYAAEAIHLIANVKAVFPKHTAYIAVHNRTVNTSGKPGHGKPVDQLIEHYNLYVVKVIKYHIIIHINTCRVFKEAIRSGGGKLTQTHVKDISMSVLFLMEAAQKTDRAFGLTQQSTTHTVSDSHSDMQKMTKYLSEANITKIVDGRSSPAFSDPTEDGWKKMSTTSWIHDTLNRTHISDEDDLQEDREEIDLNYELFDVV